MTNANSEDFIKITQAIIADNYPDADEAEKRTIQAYIIGVTDGLECADTEDDEQKSTLMSAYMNGFTTKLFKERGTKCPEH